LLGYFVEFKRLSVSRME